MSYFVTPVLGLTLANPNTGQAFETTVVNNDFTLIDTAIGSARTRLTTLESIDNIVADLDALVAVASPQAGWSRIVADGGALFDYTGTLWVQRTPAIFAGVTGRDTAYAKASGAFKVAGAQVRITSAGYLTTWSTATSTWRNNEGGLIPIIPTGVIGTGVTLAGGQINLAASPSAYLQGVFSADFEFYKIVIRYAKSASGNLQLNLGNASTPNVVAAYSTQNNIDIGTAATVPVTAPNVTFAQIDQGGVTTTGFLTLEVADPFVTSATFGLYSYTAINAPAFTARGSFVHNVATSFADLQIAPSAGTITGTMHIYGYNLT